MSVQAKVLEYTIKLTKTPTDGSGAFEAIVAGWDIDADNERFARDAFDEEDGKTAIPLHYQHLPKAADPAATIGEVFATPTDLGVKVVGQLNLKNPMAVAVYERMLLDDDDPNALKEFSVGFVFDPKATFKGEKGETVIPKAKLIEVSVVYRGAQKTELLAIKERILDAARKEFYGTLPGSAEATREELDEVTRAWAATAYPRDPDGNGPYVCLLGTFPDKVTVRIEYMDKDDLEFDIPFTRDADGVPVLDIGNITPVKVTAVVVPAKSADAEGDKMDEPFEHEQTEETKAEIDESAWDGDAALKSADTAAEFRQIAFERDNDSDPDTAAHWALPHHSSPGAPPNVRGVGAALGALNGARGESVGDLKNRDAAETHLTGHRDDIEAAQAKSVFDASQEGPRKAREYVTQLDILLADLPEPTGDEPAGE